MESVEPVPPVELVLSARSEHLRLARLIAAGVGASAGLDVDQLDDLRICVAELCGGLLEDAEASARLRLTLLGGHRCIEVVIELLGTAGRRRDLDEMRRMILDALDVEWYPTAQATGFRLVVPRGD